MQGLTPRRSQHVAGSGAASRRTPRFLHEGKVMEYEGTVFEKLVDPALYTGTHKHRFDEFGRGKGLHGRRDEYELLDSGVLFENSRSVNAGFRGGSGSSTGDASDRAESLWMKSLRAAVHSPSLAKTLEQESRFGRGGAGGARRAPAAGTAGGDDDDTRTRPLIQAWVLGDDGRLVFDDQRTRELMHEDMHDATTILSGSAAAAVAASAGTNNNPFQRGGDPATHHNAHRAYGGRAVSAFTDTTTAAQQSSYSRMQRSAPDRTKEKAVTSHMRRLLYDNTHVGNENDSFGSNDGVGHGQREAHGLGYFVNAPDGDAEAEGAAYVHQQQQQHLQPNVEPQEYFRRWYPSAGAAAATGGDEAYGGDGAAAQHHHLSLQETMQMLSDYEQQPHQR